MRTPVRRSGCPRDSTEPPAIADYPARIGETSQGKPTRESPLGSPLLTWRFSMHGQPAAAESCRCRCLGWRSGKCSRAEWRRAGRGRTRCGCSVARSLSGREWPGLGGRGSWYPCGSLQKYPVKKSYHLSSWRQSNACWDRRWRTRWPRGARSDWRPTAAAYRMKRRDQKSVRNLRV